MSKAKYSRSSTHDAPEAIDRRDTPPFKRFTADVEEFAKTRPQDAEPLTWRVLVEGLESHDYVCPKCVHQKLIEAVEMSNHLWIDGVGRTDVIKFSEKPIIEVEKDVKRYAVQISKGVNTPSWGRYRNI